MTTNHKQPGPLARAAIVIPLFLMLAAGIVLGGMLYAVLGLSAIAARVVHRVSSRRAASRDEPTAGGEVIEGSYVVLERTVSPGGQSAPMGR